MALAAQHLDGNRNIPLNPCGSHPRTPPVSTLLYSPSYQIVKLWLQTCLTDGDERGGSGGSGPSSSFTSNGTSGCGSNCAAATSTSSSLNPSSKPGLATSSASGTGGSGIDSSTGGNGSGVVSGGGGVTTTVTGSRGSNIFLEGGAASGGGAFPGAEEALPMGVASVLWELECCAAQTRITLMNLMEGRPNHFGVFRAGVYVEEIRMLEAKVGFCRFRYR